MKQRIRNGLFVLAAVLLCAELAACGTRAIPDVNLIQNDTESKRYVNLFGPTEKSDPYADNIARTAHEKTVLMAEEKLGITVEYRTYTAEDHQDKTYDEVTLDRARNNMDDLYLLNPDVIQILGSEGKLADLSGLTAAKNLREVVKTANTIDGKLVAIPQEVVAYGLFVNKELFNKYKLSLPNTPEEFLNCCKVFQENGIDTPVGANRWWLETFVFAQAYAELYNEEDTDARIRELNSGEAKYSDYMRESFEFLKVLIEEGYIDAEKAYVSEALEGERDDFLAGKCPIVMAYWGAANADTAYGNPGFDMQVIGFPSSLGQMPVFTITGYGISSDAKHMEEALAVLDEILSEEALSVYAETNQVISPSEHVEVECIDALKPLNKRINEGIYVLASNAHMQMEQWGNVCLAVRELLNGASVDDCMAEIDRLQKEAIQ